MMTVMLMVVMMMMIMTIMLITTMEPVLVAILMVMTMKVIAMVMVMIIVTDGDADGDCGGTDGDCGDDDAVNNDDADRNADGDGNDGDGDGDGHDRHAGDIDDQCDRPCVNVSELQNVRIYKTVDTYPFRSMRNTPRCRISGSIDMYAQMSHASNPRRCQLSECMKLRHRSMRPGLKTRWKMPHLRDRECKHSIQCFAKSALGSTTHKKSLTQTHRYVNLSQRSWPQPSGS